MHPSSSGLVSQRSSGYQMPSGTALRGVDFSSMSTQDKIDLLHRILERRIHGISFSPYLDGQEPGDEMSEEQIRARLAIIAPYTHWIRTFRCIEGNQHVPRIAREFGLKTMVGVDLTEDLERNEVELAAGIEIAQAGYADLFVVGNENLLRRDITEQQ
ncbi:MAG: hypothetical protein AAGN64_04715, partial [Bacteroidota bacterium]